MSLGVHWDPSQTWKGLLQLVYIYGVPFGQNMISEVHAANHDTISTGPSFGYDDLLETFPKIG